MTATQDPIGEVDARFSSEGAPSTPWADARRQLERAEVYWITTVRDDGRPHVTAMVGAWVDETLVFSTGPTEQKAKNLERNRHVVVATGPDTIEGMHLVIEGEAVRAMEPGRVERFAAAFSEKYEDPFRFSARDDVFVSDGNGALVFEVAPVTVFGFGGEGDTYSQTRWRF